MHIKLTCLILRCRISILATAIALFCVFSTSVTDAKLGTSMSTYVAFTAPAAADFEPVGQLGGTVVAISVKDNLAYIGEGASLTVLDIADPQNPMVMGKTAATTGFIYDIVVVDQVAYVAGSAGVRIIDVSNPSSPADIGFYAVIAKPNLMKKLLGLSIFQAGVFLLYITMDKIDGGTAPIVQAGVVDQIFSNPLPQVLILTAIVVGISTIALGLAVVVRIYEAYGTIEDDEIQQADRSE